MFWFDFMLGAAREDIYGTATWRLVGLSLLKILRVLIIATCGAVKVVGQARDEECEEYGHPNLIIVLFISAFKRFPWLLGPP